MWIRRLEWKKRAHLHSWSCFRFLKPKSLPSQNKSPTIPDSCQLITLVLQHIWIYRQGYQRMFPLRCARAHEPWDERTQENLKRTQIFLPKMFLHIFHTHRYKYIWVLVKCCTKEILCAHRLLKIRVNSGINSMGAQTPSTIVAWCWAPTINFLSIH